MFRSLLPLLISLPVYGASFDLTWDVPPADSRITGYELQWGNASGAYTQSEQIVGYNANEASIDTGFFRGHVAVRTVGQEDGATIYSSFSNELVLEDVDYATVPEDLVFGNLVRIIVPPLDPSEVDAAALVIYRFEGDGSIIEDETNTLDGDLVADAVRTAAGKYGKGIEFNGSSGMIDLGNMDIPGAGLTLMAWIRADGFGIYDARLISKATGVQENDHYWMLGTFSNDSIRFRLKAGGYTTTLISSESVIGVNQWHHVAAVYDGAEMRIVVDGLERGSAVKTGAVDTSAAVPAAIGNQPQGSKSFDGTVDEVKLFNYALTEEELSAAMSAPAEK